MGVGQRVVRSAAYVGGAIVAGGSDRLRGVLRPVYAALELPFDPKALGSVEDERAGTGPDEVAMALLAVLARHYTLEPDSLDPELLSRAERTQARYAVA
jgi:octanoyl-[GcvH]:protein N-octanoyltransferase